MKSRLRALLLEDDAEDALLFQRLAAAHMQVHHVATAAAALSNLLEGGYDICFADYRLADEDGLSLVRRARAEGLRLPIVVITGLDLETLGENALLAGATDFMPKDDLSADSVRRVLRWALIRQHVDNRLADGSTDQLLDHLIDREPPPVQTPSRLRRLLYISRARQPLAQQDLLRMCAGFAAANARSGVTGALIVAGNRFLQVIEGTPETVEALMSSIQRDTRHSAIAVVYDESATQRLFSNWNMAAVHLRERYDCSPTLWAGVKTKVARLLARSGLTRDSMAELIRSLPGILMASPPLDGASANGSQVADATA